MKEKLVFVVDDESSIVKMLTQWLENKGFQVFGSTSPLEVQEVVQKIENPALLLREPAFLLIDVIMAEMTGVELAKNLRNIWPMLIVIFITGYEFDLTDQMSAISSFRLNKPFGFEELESFLEGVGLL